MMQTPFGSDQSTAPHPLLSIGLPVHNGANFLAETLRSIASQTFTDFELIIADNASTDATASICLEFARLDPRVRYVRHPENVGAAANFNPGAGSSERLVMENFTRSPTRTRITGPGT